MVTHGKNFNYKNCDHYVALAKHVFGLRAQLGWDISDPVLKVFGSRSSGLGSSHHICDFSLSLQYEGMDPTHFSGVNSSSSTSMHASEEARPAPTRRLEQVMAQPGGGRYDCEQWRLVRQVERCMGGASNRRMRAEQAAEKVMRRRGRRRKRMRAEAQSGEAGGETQERAQPRRWLGARDKERRKKKKR